MIRPPRHSRGTKANEGLYNLGKKKLGGFPAIARVENTVSLNLRLLSSVTYSQLSLTSRRICSGEGEPVLRLILWLDLPSHFHQFHRYRCHCHPQCDHLRVEKIFDPKVDSSFYSASQVESTTKRTKHGETTSGNRLCVG